MKKVLCGLVIAIMMTGSGYAETVGDNIKSLESIKLKGKKGKPGAFIKTYCVYDYLFIGFANFEHIQTHSQHFSIQDGKSMPTKCSGYSEKENALFGSHLTRDNIKLLESLKMDGIPRGLIKTICVYGYLFIGFVSLDPVQTHSQHFSVQDDKFLPTKC